MTLPSKLLWSEGLAIGPQQFQQLDRYHEARLQRLMSLLNPHLWGMRALSWNADALANNSLRADTLSLVFQDGEIYEAPLGDALPSPVDLSRLPSDAAQFYVLCGAAGHEGAWRQSGARCALSAGRYRHARSVQRSRQRAGGLPEKQSLPAVRIANRCTTTWPFRWCACAGAGVAASRSMPPGCRHAWPSMRTRPCKRCSMR